MSSSLPRSTPGLLLAGALCLLAATQARAQVGLRGPKPPTSSPGARFALFRQCPGVESVLEAELAAGDSTPGVWLQRGWWRSAAAQRSGDFIELREEGAGLENVRRVNLRACSVLGYSWATFDGGRGLPGVFTGVSLFREGRRVTWSGLSAAERSTLLKLMRAREGDAREASLVGALFRAWEAGQVRPPAAAPALRKQAGLEPAFLPRAEGRVFIPCEDGSPACTGALGGNLQMGTRLRRQEPLGPLDVYRVEVSPNDKVTLERVFPPGERLLVCARSRGTCAVPFESPAPLSFGPVTRVAERALRITVRTRHPPYISVAPWLFDAASGALHALPGASSEGTETVLVADDGTHHVAWFEDGHGEVVDYAALLASQGEAGRTTVPAGEALSWAEAHGSAATVVTALLLARDEPARAAAQAVLARLPGWEAPVDRAVGVRAGSQARVLASLAGHPPTVSPEPWSLLVPVGARGDEVWALWDEEGDAAFDAALILPKGALLSIEALQRLGALEAALSEQEVCPRGQDAGCAPYAEAVNTALRQGTPSRAVRQGLCGAERELLGRGFQRAELLEVVEVSCSWPEWTHPGQAGRLELPPQARCEAWKALCAP